MCLISGRLTTDATVNIATAAPLRYRHDAVDNLLHTGILDVCLHQEISRLIR